MRIKSFFIVLVLLQGLPMFLSGCGETEWPEGCPHGEETLPNFNDPDSPGAYFDFSAGEIVYGEEGRTRGDIFLERTFVAGNPELGVAIHDQQPDSLLYDLTAPSWGSTEWKVSPNEGVPPRTPLYEGHNIWVKTAEGHTAKFKILLMESNEDHSSYIWIKIRWIYQPDGTDSFL